MHRTKKKIRGVGRERKKKIRIDGSRRIGSDESKKNIRTVGRQENEKRISVASEEGGSAAKEKGGR